ncbi:MAG TPA: 50S ribosomal protein L20 [Candidatus Saccharimonadales bacterium]|nr:50S ribosomal protein L20 [Candidatus Saccharimonadales bacterium]
MRVKRGVTAHRKHKKILKQTKGMQHARRSSYRLAKQAVIRALQYSYRDRRTRKRDLRQLWVIRINAAAHEHDTTYSKLMSGLKKADIRLNRKVLSELAVNEPKAFEAVLKTAK